MLIFFSPTNKCFYYEVLLAACKSAGNLPEDIIEIPEGVYEQFLGLHPNGKEIGADERGMPVWVDTPPLSHDEAHDMAEMKKLGLISDANTYINSKQWPGKAILGRLTDTEKDQYNLWLDYLDALEAVDTSSAPDIKWPIPPGEQAS